uniref:Pru domain-containing protein n=1 Tax=Trichuris muris TaxID=70415 RepID=A0A5S6QU51_TRIMR
MMPHEDSLQQYSHKGLFYLYEDENGFVCHCWKDRESGSIENERMLLPGEAEFTKLPEYAPLRVYQMTFVTEAEKLYYWMQEKDESSDEARCNAANEILNYEYKEGENISVRLNGKQLTDLQSEGGRINVNHIMEIMRILEQATKSLEEKSKREEASKRTERSHEGKDGTNDVENDNTDKTLSSNSEEEEVQEEEEGEEAEEKNDNTKKKKKEGQIKKEILRSFGQALKYPKPVVLTRKGKKGNSFSDRKTLDNEKKKNKSMRTNDSKKQRLLYALETGLNLLLQTITEESKRNAEKLNRQHDNKEQINVLKRNLPTKLQIQKYFSGQSNDHSFKGNDISKDVSFISQHGKQNRTPSSANSNGQLSKLVEAQLKMLQSMNNGCRHCTKTDSINQGKQRSISNPSNTRSDELQGKNVGENEKSLSTQAEDGKQTGEQNQNQENQTNQLEDKPKPKPILVILRPRGKGDGQDKLRIRNFLLKNALHKRNKEQDVEAEEQYPSTSKELIGQPDGSKEKVIKCKEEKDHHYDEDNSSDDDNDEYDDDDAAAEDKNSAETENALRVQYIDQCGGKGVSESDITGTTYCRHTVNEDERKHNVMDSRSYRAAIISKSIRDALIKNYRMNDQVKDGFTSPTSSKIDEESITELQEAKDITETQEAKDTVTEKESSKNNSIMIMQELSDEQNKNTEKENGQEQKKEGHSKNETKNIAKNSEKDKDNKGEDNANEKIN